MGEGSVSGTVQRRAFEGLLLFAVAFAVIALDQITKYLVRANMVLGQSIPEEGFFRLTYTSNTGGAFSLFANQNFLLAVAAIIGIAVFVVYVRYLPLTSRLLRASLGLLLGGATGNLIDRVRFGGVTDFVDVGAWPIFNVADAALTVGTVLVIYHLLLAARPRT